jgi:membrane-bound inhibitor of C-type lysozyme
MAAQSPRQRAMLAAALTLGVMLGACGGSATDKAGPAGTASAAGVPAARGTPDTGLDYVCSDGVPVFVRYTEDGPEGPGAEVTRAGQTVIMRAAASASGAKFTGETLVWWSKGNEAMLLTPEVNGKDKLIATCREK